MEEPASRPSLELDHIRHSAAHVLAMAAIRLFPDAKIGVGPVTGDGFYYDFEFSEPVTWDDVKKIEEEMNIIIQQDLPFSRLVVPKDQAFNILLSRMQIYKAEILRELDDEEVSFFKTGEEFIDLCRGPHVTSTGQIGAVKLTSLSTVHWRNDESRPQLQRISGVAFRNFPELKDFLSQQEAIKNRDFRNIAKKLALSLGGNREIIYTRAGSKALDILKSHCYNSLKEIQLQHIVAPSARSLLDLHKAPDNLYGRKNRSYKELPARYYQFNTHEFDEPLMIGDKDVRTASIIFAKIFCAPESGSSEINTMVPSILNLFRDIQLRPRVEISTPHLDLQILDIIGGILKRENVSQTVVVEANRANVQVKFQVEDKLGRVWSLANLVYGVSEQQYVNKKGDFQNAHEISFWVVLDALLAYFLESEDGLLPLWLAPQQVNIIPITDVQRRYATQISKMLKNQGYRTKVDDRSETMQSKIRDAELIKVPIIIIVGEKESNSGTVSLRLRNNQDLGLISTDKLIETLSKL